MTAPVGLLRSIPGSESRETARRGPATVALCASLHQERHVSIVARRATFVGRPPRVYAYVHKQVPSAAAPLDRFLFRSGVAPNERVTVISDDAGEFVKTVEAIQLARHRILDWFHIAMKFKAAQNAVRGWKVIQSLERRT